MTPARPPKLLFATLIALMLLLFNHKSFHINLGKSSMTFEANGGGRAAMMAADQASGAKKAPPETGMSAYPAGIQPTNRLLASATAIQPTVIPFPSPTIAPTYDPDTGYRMFVDRVADGETGVIRGVYVRGIFALKVVQQPQSEWGYVSQNTGTATEFQNATRNGVTGLLAHNYLSGILFYRLKVGDEVRVVYGDSSDKRYRVAGIYEFQKLNPASTQSELIDLSTGTKLSTENVFNQFYRGGHHLTLQTCLKVNDDWSWGLTFVVANPIAN